MTLKPIISAIFAVLAMLATFAGPAAAASAAAIEADARDTLERFYRNVGGARDLAQKSVGMLVFPSVVKAGMGIGGEYGEGVLFERGHPNTYYNTVSASIGFQLGVQARSVIIMFMNRQALASFRRTDGWKVGVDGSIAIITVGAGGSIDTSRITSPIVGFILDPKGLMYNLTLEGSKISRIRK
ncbi:MAG TPA: YSC84-related protein [Hyphomicrobium sp.]|nr:YSC84-related protein [Hyphomicrobium sp.]